jgi:hypothetical protein
VGGREHIASLLRPLVERMHTGYCWKKTQDGPRRIDVEFAEILLSEHVTNQSPTACARSRQARARAASPASI